jgi:hypothetical protein
MSALSIQPTYPIFTDIDGQPLENGYIWIGTANLDPQTNPINVYWDAALTISATQPIRTLGGYPSRSGTPARLYVNSDYSIRVQNRNGSLVYSAPSATERYSNVVVTGVNAQDVIYDPPFAGGVSTNVEAKLAQVVSVLDYGADPTGTNDSTTAIQTAINANKYVLIPYGVYRCDNIITIQSTYNNQKHVQMLGAQLIRRSANSVAVGPVIELLGSYGSFDGGHGFITTENNTPRGVVALGHSDNTTSNYTAVHWTFKNATVEAKVFSGSTPTYFQSIGVYIPSSQPFLGSGAANYFGNVENVNVQNASVAFWLTDLVNGCTFVNCTVNGFWYTAFTLNGAYGNTFYGGFLEYCYQNSKIAIQLYTKLYPAAPYASPTLESMWNNFFGSTMELYGTSMIGIDIQVNCQGNFVQFNWNSVGQAIRDSDGFNTILESRVNQFTKVSSNTITGVGSAAQEVGILPTAASYVVGYGVYVNSGGTFYPSADNTTNLGTAVRRWKEVFAANAVINTSDARLKEQDRSLSDAERAVAVKVKGLLKAFKFKDAVQAKGDKARIHFGVYAQEVVEAFASEGLNANDYGMLCFDKWDAEEAVVDRDGNITKPAQEAGESYGIRYEELLAFIIAAI